MKNVKKLMALLLAGVMLMGLSVTAFASSSDPGYTTTFSGSSMMSAMANDVFQGADMTYDEDEDETTIQIYAGVYSRTYNGSTACGWIDSLTVTYDGEEFEFRGTYATTSDYTYPAVWTISLSGDLTAGTTLSITATIHIEDSTYDHGDQTGTLTITPVTAAEE